MSRARRTRCRAVASLVLLAVLVVPAAAGAAWRPVEVFRGVLQSDQAIADDVGHLVFLPYIEGGSVVRTFDARTRVSRVLAPGGACPPRAARAEVALVQCLGSDDAYVTRLDVDEAVRVPGLEPGASALGVGRRWVASRVCRSDPMGRVESICGPLLYVDWRTGVRAGPFAGDQLRDLDSERLGRVRPVRSPARRTRAGRLTVRTAGGRSVVLSRRCSGACRVASTSRDVVWLIGRRLRAYDLRTGRRYSARLPISGDGRLPVVVSLWATRRAAFVHISTGVRVPIRGGETRLGEDLLLALPL